MAALPLDLSADALANAFQDSKPTSEDLLPIIERALDDLPDKLTLSKGRVLAGGLELYARFGDDYTHLIRYLLGAVALRVKEDLGHGSDAFGQCAEAWDLAVSTLRLYAACVKRTGGKVRLFYSFLRSTYTLRGKSATQKDIETFTQAMKDPDITPPEIAREIEDQRVEAAIRTIADAHTRELENGNPDKAHSITIGLAGSVGTDIDYAGDGAPDEGTAEPVPGMDRGQYEQILKQCLHFLDEATQEWCVWNGEKVAPPAAVIIRRILEWSYFRIYEPDPPATPDLSQVEDDPVPRANYEPSEIEHEIIA